MVRPARPPLPVRAVLALLPMWCAACGDWPRWSHLPDAGSTLPGDIHPRAAVQVTWSDVLGGDEEQPPGTPLGDLLPAQGLHLTGVTDGAGWSDTRVPAPLHDDACGTTGDRAPVAGDYTGDVDVHQVTTTADGRLCLRAQAGDATAGYDLLLFPLDACGIPGDPVVDPATLEVGGAGVAGPTLDWSPPVPAGRYAVLIAAFAPVDPDAVFAWELGISLVDGALCPLLPGEDLP